MIEQKDGSLRSMTASHANDDSPVMSQESSELSGSEKENGQTSVVSKVRIT